MALQRDAASDDVLLAAQGDVDAFQRPVSFSYKTGLRISTTLMC